MVGGLGADFDLAEGYACVVCGFVQHLLEQLVLHEVGAAAGGQIAAPGQTPHGTHIDVLVAPERILHGEIGRASCRERV